MFNKKMELKRIFKSRFMFSYIFKLWKLKQN